MLPYICTRFVYITTGHFTNQGTIFNTMDSRLQRFTVVKQDIQYRSQHVPLSYLTLPYFTTDTGQNVEFPAVLTV